MNLYNACYSLTQKNPPSIIFSKAKLPSETPLIPLKPNQPLKIKREKLYKKGEFEDERLLFAKLMRNIELKVQKSSTNEENNLEIPRALDYRFSHNKAFVGDFHSAMKNGFSKVKNCFLNIKALNDKWESQMYA